MKVAADLTSSVADDAVDSGNPIKVGGRAHDTTAALGAVADGDRYDLFGDQHRRTWINESCNVAGSVVGLTTSGTPDTATQADSAKLSGRKKVILQNRSNKAIYVGFDSGVTTPDTAATQGVTVPRRTSWSADIGEAIDLYVVADDASLDYHLTQLA